MIVIIGFIFAGLLLMNSGVLIYNQGKIGFVAHSAASFAASLTNAATRQADVDSHVSNTMANLGLDATNTTTSITDIDVSSKPAVTVTVKANLPTLLSANFGNLLPQQVQLSETAVALKPINTMKYIVVIHPWGGQITLPLVNATGYLPNDGLPAWQISLAGVRKIR